MARLSRRELMLMSAATMLLPRRALAASPSSGRKFLFLFCPGGWDPAMVFAPVFNDDVDHFMLDESGTVGGITFSDSSSRPSVRSFLEQYGSRTAMLNGIEIASVAHDVCSRLVMTGSAQGSSDDWVSTIASRAPSSLILPNVHISGPLYPVAFPTASVRLGTQGQLSSLLDGSALSKASTPAVALPADVAALQEAAVRDRIAAFAGRHPRGLGADIAAAELLARDRAASLVSYLDILGGAADNLVGALDIAAGCLEAGLSQTAMVAYGEGGNGDWDTHSVNDFQDQMFEYLFGCLETLVARLDGAPGAEGGSLLDETVVVVLSEMGRTPKHNAAGGKDHWTWTSAMLIGGGVRGDQTVGEWSESLTGNPVDFQTGAADPKGQTIRPADLGATLLALADIDPADFIDPEDGTIIDALIE